MIAGVVTTKHVLLHSVTIVQDFGLHVWLMCCKAVLTNPDHVSRGDVARMRRALDAISDNAFADPSK